MFDHSAAQLASAINLGKAAFAKPGKPGRRMPNTDAAALAAARAVLAEHNFDLWAAAAAGTKKGLSTIHLKQLAIAHGVYDVKKLTCAAHQARVPSCTCHRARRSDRPLVTRARSQQVGGRQGRQAHGRPASIKIALWAKRTSPRRQ